MALQAAKRNAAKLQRTPKWLNDGHLFEIESVYNYCSALRRIGLNYHVDHIVPLQGKIISGLHLPWNLQVLPAKINWVKGNKLWL
jgi:5-methylcytosine-specific restriction endonuclease McrA